MNHRERILRVIRGERVDHVPWAPRWDLWYGAACADGRLPERYRGWHIFDVARDLNMGIKAHFKGAWRSVLHDIEIREFSKGDETRVEYDTPLGTLSTVWRQTPEMAAQGVPGLRIKYPITCAADYGPAKFLLEKMEIIPQHDQIRAQLDLIGNDGCLLVHTGHCPASWAMIDWFGHEQFYYHMVDFPDRLDHLLATMEQVRDQTVEIVANSQTAIASLDGNYDMAITPPPIFRKYFSPYLKKAVSRLHNAGKIVSTHVDGDNRKLLEPILDVGFDIGEAFTSPPMTHLTVRDAKRVWGDKMTIWGGITANLFTPEASREEFEAQVLDILDCARQQGQVILGTGDNVPTDGELERINWVTRAVEIHGGF